MNSNSFQELPSSNSEQQKALVTELIFDFGNYLNDWERKFCHSISDALDKGWILSAKQVGKLRAIQAEVIDKVADNIGGDRMRDDPDYFHNE